MVGFANAMQQAGISPPNNIQDDGTLHRFYIEGDKPHSKNGWYVLHNDPLAGAFGNWKLNVSEIWSKKEYKAFTDEEKARYKANMEAQKKEREAEQQRIHAECRERAAAIWNQAKPAPEDNPYLIRKRVKPYGIRQYKDALIIQLRDGSNTIHGLQFINPDGSKKFLTGTAKAGHYFRIGGKPETVFYLAEGFATAATIHEATGQPVAVCFDAGNLKPVAEVLRDKLPDIQITVCADNDRQTEGNPGLTKAKAAAVTVGGLLALPVFPDGMAGTDFNDLAAAVGLDEVKRQVETAIPPEANSWKAFVPLQKKTEPKAFPIDALPPSIRDAITEYHQYGKQPLSLIASSALATMSLACQCHCNVARDERLISPISLNFLVVAESGERKTTVDKTFADKPRKWLRRLQLEYKEKMKALDPEIQVWETREAGLKNRLKSEKNQETIKEIEDELRKHLLNKPEIPPKPELFLSDTNQASLIDAASNNGLYGCALWDDEGGTIIGSNGTQAENVMSFFSVLNKGWDGSKISQTRISGNRSLEGRRITVNIVVQEAVAKRLIEGNSVTW